MLLFFVLVCKLLILSMLTLHFTSQIFSWVTSMMIKSLGCYMKDELDPASHPAEHRTACAQTVFSNSVLPSSYVPCSVSTACKLIWSCSSVFHRVFSICSLIYERAVKTFYKHWKEKSISLNIFLKPTKQKHVHFIGREHSTVVDERLFELIRMWQDIIRLI